MKYQFEIIENTDKKEKPDFDNLPFGLLYTDHMFVMDYDEEKGWHNGKILPFSDLRIHPAAMVLHYAQATFEGLKAYKKTDGSISLFRPYMNAARINNSNDRLCMPKMDEELFVSAVKTLVSVDRDWIPEGEGTSLYIRPLIIATEPYIGIKRSSKTYKLIIILSPVGSYFKNGLTPTRMCVENEYTRAAKGGTGEAKCGGNYAGGLKAQAIAAEKGYEQVLWLDAKEHKYIEEIGAANAFFVIDDEIITGELTGTILPGITRDSIIALCKKKGYKITERRLSIEELHQAYKEGRLKEMFASGTAAIIAPVGELYYNGDTMVINEGKIGKYAREMYDTIYGIQTGRIEDFMNWLETVE